MAAAKTLCLTINVDRVQKGLYQAEVGSGTISGPEARMYSSIEEAIREEALDVPNELTHFMEVRYGGMSSGAIPLAVLPEKAKEVADHLVALVAEWHRLEG